MVELADTLGLGSSSLKRVGVQVPFLVFYFHATFCMEHVFENP